MKQAHFLLAGTIALSAVVGAALANVPQLHSLQQRSPAVTASPGQVSPSNPRREPVPQQASPQTQSTPVARLDDFPHKRLNLKDRVKSTDDFFEFRERLREAVRERDAEFIRSIAAPGIKLSFGGSLTLDDLDLDNPDAPIWSSMEKVFYTGCAKSSQPVRTPTWVCPQVFAVWPDNVDAFDNVAIVGEGVNVRQKPKTDSAVVGILSNEVVELNQKELQKQGRFDFDKLDEWTPVILPNKRKGYVSNRYVYSPVGYRAFFEKIDGDWKMSLFIAGD